MSRTNSPVLLSKKYVVVGAILIIVAIAVLEPELIPLVILWFRAKENNITTAGRRNLPDISSSPLLFSCTQKRADSTVQTWRKPPYKVVVKSLTQNRTCLYAAQNHWGDVLSLIHHRLSDAPGKFQSRWDALQQQTPYFELPKEVRVRVEAMIMEKLIDSSNTASGQYVKEGLETTQAESVAKIQYVKAFKQVTFWAEQGKPMTLVNILDLHQTLYNSSSGSGKLRASDGGLELIFFASHTLIPQAFKNLIDYLNNPPHQQHVLEVALIAHQVITALHPMYDANGRLGMLLINWHLMAHGLPPVAYSFNTMRRLTIFSSLSEEGVTRFKEISSGVYEQRYGIHPVKFAPGIFADMHRRHAIETTWGKGEQGAKYYQDYITMQQNWGEQLLELITNAIEEAYGAALSEQGDSMRLK